MDWRLVIIWSPLNAFVYFAKFRMDTVASVLFFTGKGNFMLSVELKDAFKYPYIQSLEYICDSADRVF